MPPADLRYLQLNLLAGELGHLAAMKPFATIAGVVLPAGCAAPRPLTLDTVAEVDLCLCATAEPPHDNRGRCLAELARRELTSDAAHWSRRGP